MKSVRAHNPAACVRQASSPRSKEDSHERVASDTTSGRLAFAEQVSGTHSGFDVVCLVALSDENCSDYMFASIDRSGIAGR